MIGLPRKKVMRTRILKEIKQIASYSMKKRGREILRIRDHAVFFLIVDAMLPESGRMRTGEYFHLDDKLFSHSLVRDLLEIIIYEYYEMEAAIIVGAYSSAARTLRTTLEVVVNIFGALTNKKIFTNRKTDEGRAMCGNEFFHNLAIQQYRKGKEKIDRQLLLHKWTKSHEHQHLYEANYVASGAEFVLDKIDEKFLEGLNTSRQSGRELIRMCYYVLSDYVHLSFHSTINRMNNIEKNSYFNPEEFDDLYATFRLVSDIVAYLTILAIIVDFGQSEEWRTNYHKRLKKELEGLFQDNGGDGFHFTRRLIASNRIIIPKIIYPESQKG